MLQADCTTRFSHFHHLIQKKLPKYVLCLYHLSYTAGAAVNALHSRSHGQLSNISGSSEELNSQRA